MRVNNLYVKKVSPESFAENFLDLYTEAQKKFAQPVTDGKMVLVSMQLFELISTKIGETAEILCEISRKDTLPKGEWKEVEYNNDGGSSRPAKGLY